MSRAYVTRDDFAKAAKEGNAPSNAVLRKSYTCDSIKADDQKSKARQFVVSTASVDRDNDVISPKGWHLDNYRKNPVVLFAHDYTSLPIGKCIDIKMAGGQLIATAEFADHEMANTVLRLLDGGFLNATSVGFRPVKYQLNDERRGVDFEEQELLEFSIVPVPANPDALIVSREAYSDIELIRGWATKTLEALSKVKAPVSPDAPQAPQGNEQKPPKDDDSVPDAKNPKPPPKPVISDNADVPNANAPGASNPNDATPDDDDDQPADKKAAEIALMVVRILKGGCSCLSKADHDGATCTCCMKGDCECSYCTKAATAVAKRGRVLNARNEAKLRAAHGHIDDVLKSLPDESSDDGGDMSAAGDSETKEVKEIVIDLDDLVDDDEINLDDFKDVLGDVLKNTVRETVRDIVTTETQSALNRARGRLD